MPDPVISSVAVAVASKAAEMAVQGGKDACAALVKLVRERFGPDKAAAAALEQARQNPEDQTAVAGLVLALERYAEEDPGFAARVRELWPRVAAEISASEGSVVNSVTGTVTGHVMQARDVRVEGGLRFGDITH